ncbi:ORC2-domain-containing protein [Sistotremastrum suecicum HHB10207 ss-3]|uniref:Origin recognition complex subunit 2 n=1 Tax=Sistotremastrum suecicum HHB10207 ss-3 TaxID=1314776 RepID=A0A166BQR0_9AGAM|nr:ORC2-domain-containing protein [Sistotremastrum suecicum HHB10207 ss-3]
MPSQSPRNARSAESPAESSLNTPTTSRGRIYVISDATTPRSLRSGARKDSSRKSRRRLDDDDSSPASSPTKPKRGRGRPPTKPKIKFDEAHRSDSSLTDEEMDQDGESEDEINGLRSSPLKGKGKAVILDKSSPPPLHRSSFEAYFEAFSKKSITSSSAYSFLVPPLPTSFDLSSVMPQNAAICDRIEEQHAQDFPRWLLEMQEGFNLIFYGYGSKHDILGRFAREACAKRGDVAIINGTSPSCGIKDILGALTNFIPSPQKENIVGKALDTQLRGIQGYYASGRCRRHLYLIIESIDSPTLLNPRIKEFINNLASLPRIHLAGSVEHLNAPLAWNAREIYSRKYSTQSFRQSFHNLQFLWHDLSTLKPYLSEIAHRDLTVPPTTSSHKRPKDAQHAGGTGVVSETAAQHILASVTERAKKLFALIAKRQLASSSGVTASPAKAKEGPPAEALPYSALFTSARDDFLVTNDAQLKTLLGEFTDHGLITISTAGRENENTGEVLWVAMRPEALRAVINAM